MTALLFDFGGTLDGDGTTWLDRFYFLYREEGLALSREEFAPAFYAADDQLARRHALGGLSFEATVSLQNEDLARALGRPELGPRVAKRFVADCRRCFERNKPLLARLARRHRLGIVSNFYGNLESVLGSEGLSGFFGVVADSAVVGSSKPERAIFVHALEALAARREDAVMIGDSIPRDMRGAEDLGLRHALITSGDARCCQRGLVAASLLELEPQLG